MRKDDLFHFGCFVLRLQKHDTCSISAVTDALAFRSLARAIGGLAVVQCNREMTPRENARLEKLKDRVHSLAVAYKCETYECHNDPRGASIRLYWKDSHPYNGGSGTGYAVPE